MARMIPPVMGDNVESDGERELFHAFKTDADMADWVVLHSLDVANHTTQTMGEIDFVVIVPRLGVICLEVKACRSLEIREGRWRYGRSQNWDARGPFKQAALAMHSLREQIVKTHPELSSVVFSSAVAFTHMPFDLASPEWRRWQALDQNYLESRGLAAALIGVLRSERRRLTETPSARWFKANNDKPNVDDMGRLAAALRPNFESYESPRARMSRIHAEVKKFTEDQFRALDFAEGNERIIFEGPAGTGKTMLAIESARRAARLGRRTLFLCFNELLGDWLERELEPLASAVDFDRIARRMARLSGLRVEDDANFWENKLPSAAIAALKDDPESPFRSYDELIVDEMQDFLREGFVDLLDECVVGGLQRGRVKFFGDFERQSVYRSAALTLDELKEGWIPDLARFRLRDNCRNTPRVAKLASVLGGLDPDYRSILRQDDYIEPTVVEYRYATEQPGKLIEALMDLLGEGFEIAEIAVLSMRPEDMCMTRVTGGETKSQFSGGGKLGRGGVFSSTVRRFKGLEAPAVVVTDIEDLHSDEAQKLLYVAVTRAVSRLVLLIRADARAQFMEKSEGTP